MKFQKEDIHSKLCLESLDDIIVTEPNKPIEVEENLTDMQYGMLNTLNTLMQEELDAIQSYNDAVVQCIAAGYGEFSETLKSIASEETVHLGELQKLYDNIKGGTIEKIQDGQEEASEILDLEPEEIKREKIEESLESLDYTKLKSELEAIPNVTEVQIDKDLIYDTHELVVLVSWHSDSDNAQWFRDKTMVRNSSIKVFKDNNLKLSDPVEDNDSYFYFVLREIKQ